MIHIQRIYLAIFLFVFLFGLIGCSSDSDSSDDSGDDPTSTAASVDGASAEAEAIETEEATAEVTAAVTEEAAVTPDVFDTGNPSTSADGEYFITVSYVLEEGSFSEVNAAPDGQRWVVVNASLGNTTSTDLAVNAERLTLIDTLGERYIAEPTFEDLSPSLTDTTIPAGESLLGFALFGINANAVPFELEWCVDAACEEILVARIP